MFIFCFDQKSVFESRLFAKTESVFVRSLEILCFFFWEKDSVL